MKITFAVLLVICAPYAFLILSFLYLSRTQHKVFFFCLEIYFRSDFEV
jgi:hypothetical protein